MKFTIFTSFHNYLETFDELVESVFSQTYSNWEWIVSDDFSENTEVIEKLKQLELSSSKIKLVLPQFKKQFYWNPPISESNGDIFMVLDSDDKMHPKLLEVYKHNFDKFPEVQMISTNSILRWGNINGKLHSFRIINYGEKCNFIEKLNSATWSEYHIGDCRAWRNNISIFDPEHKWKHCAEDVCKTLINEEIGKLLYLPRTLHTYAHRENSISKLKVNDYDLLNEPLLMVEESNKRKNRKYYNSIEDYYDRVFNHTTPFYLSSLNYENDSCSVLYIDKYLNARKIESLKSLYFDHDLCFDYYTDIDYLIIKMYGFDVDLLSNYLEIKPRKELVIESDLSVFKDVCNFLTKKNIQYYWFEFCEKVYFIIKFHYSTY